MLTQHHLKSLVSYNPETGLFIWLAAKSNRCKAGSIAGCKTFYGYSTISVNTIRYPAHRLAWLYMTGKFPTEKIDHINGIRDDNRFCNLREATNKQNLQNIRKPHKDNRTGFLGVWEHIPGSFRARIMTNGKTTHIGCYKTPEEAHNAYLNAKRVNHEFNTL